jgi:glycosyltransferase involved in cell wall biosynthesis
VRVLFIEKSVGVSGSTVSLSSLLHHLDPDVYDRHVVLSSARQEAYVRAQVPDGLTTAVIVEAQGVKSAGWVRRVTSRLAGRAPRLKRVADAALGVLDAVAGTLPYTARLYRFARKHRIDLVHQNNGFELGALVVSRLCRIPMVAYQRGDEWSSFSTRRFAPSVDRYVANSEATKDNLLSLGVPPEIITVVYPPLDLAVFDHARPRSLRREEFGVSATAPCFGILGTLREWKGQRVFVQAAHRVFEVVPDARAFIIGGTSGGYDAYERELRALVKTLGIEDRVVFTGFQADVPGVIQLLDVVVHATITKEPFGRVIVEAMAMKKPVVASRSGGPTEIIEDGRTGFLVAPGDDAAMAERIVRLLTDRRLAQDMGEAGYREVTQRFAVSHHVAQVDAVYRSILAVQRR